MICKYCGSNNVSVQMVQNKSKTHTKGRGLHYSIIRMCLVVSTLGLWLLVPESKGKSSTSHKFKKIHICQECGKTF